jgi:hypothetical protein
VRAGRGPEEGRVKGLGSRSGDWIAGVVTLGRRVSLEAI